MLQVTINVNANSARAQEIKESLAMFLERWGDSKVVQVKEIQPKDWVAEQQRLY